MTELNKKLNKKLSKSALVLIISCVIIAIPVLIFGIIILSSVINTGKPILGSRFKNDLNPSISESVQKDLAKEIKNFDSVENCEIVMTSAQLRINIDANDSISEENAKEIAEKALDKVNTKLPLNTYFTMSSDGQKMYDLAINVYNYIPKDTEDEGWISFLITKNSKMEEKEEQYISKAVSPELAKELRGEVETSDQTIEPTESEETSE